MRIADKSHEFILDEILGRERLEHNPSRVFVAADEDSESHKDDKDDEDGAGNLQNSLAKSECKEGCFFFMKSFL